MEIHIGDRVADVSLVSKEGNKVTLTIDGEKVEVDIVFSENGSCSIIHDGNSFNAGLVRSEGGKSYDVSILRKAYQVEIVDSQAKYLNTRRSEEEKASNQMFAPMPGKIVSIAAKEGDRLKAGDIVVVLEAMKMQSNYKATADCIVKKIYVNEGDSVNANQLMVELELIEQ